jgi:membrane protein YqaA with SNARE-associated domain
VTFYVRLAGILAAAGIGISLVWPEAAALVPYVGLAIWFNGPPSVVIPAGFEPVLLLYGELYPPLLVAALGVAGNVVIESVNYRIFVAAADSTALRRVHASRAVRWLARGFGRAPFAVVAVIAAALPLWTARTMAALSAYSHWRYLAATGLGRFPRFFLFASIGAALGIPADALAGFIGLVVLATVVGLLGKWLVQRARRETPRAIGGPEALAALPLAEGVTSDAA